MNNITINPNTASAYQLFHDGILALGRAEQQGMRIDLDYVKATKEKLSKKIQKIEKGFEATSFYKHWKHTSKGIPNIGSNPQLASFLYKVKKITPAKLTETGKGSTDDDALKQLQMTELDMILEIRKLKKVRDTYLDAFAREQVKGYIHPFFNLHIPVTFRSSSNSPNFQNQPKRDPEAMMLVRDAVYPRPGHQFLAVDFKGIEVAIASCYHKDPVMIKYLKDSTSDMHGDMAAQIFCVDDFDKHITEHKYLRTATKNGFVFPQFYGDYYKNNAVSLCQWVGLSHGAWKTGQGVKMPGGKFISNHMREQGINSFDGFCTHLQEIESDFWKRRFKVYGKWKEKWYAEYLKNGYMDSYTGFRFKGVMRKNEVINYPVQGAAFHCLLWCFIQLDKFFAEKGWKTRLVGQIHDEITLDVAPDELLKVCKIVKRVTTVDLPKAFKWINVPLEVSADLGDVDGSWATLKEFKLP